MRHQMVERAEASSQPGQQAYRVSVVIPTYNQAKYLPAAVHSALTQRHRPLEVIVVDDGSSDECRQVAARFGPPVVYLFQENQGLAGARNTGILAAQGDLVGLLDADDEWMPDFLAAMVARFRDDPTASVCYCCAQAVDDEGRVLPQVFGGPPVAPDRMHRALLRANFLIPSTVVMRRDIALSAGLFDATLRSRAGHPSAQGCEDWDLWLRLLPGHRFLGLPDCLVRYRIHGASLSANPDGMLRAAMTVVEKHFGPDDGQWNTWTADRRRAHGGVHRYAALMSVSRLGDWAAAARHLRRALLIDPSLATDVDLFYELALGTEIPGARGAAQTERLAARAGQVVDLLADVFSGAINPEIEPLRRDLTGTALHGLGLAAYNSGQHALARRLLLGALRRRPVLWRNAVVVGDLVKSLVRSVLPRLSVAAS